MGVKLRETIRARVIISAMAETRLRGDRRLGTEHLLLALLGEDAGVARALGVDVEAARAALDALDRAALASIGIELGEFRPGGPVASGKRTPLTSAARAVLHRAVKQSGRPKRVTAEHLLLSLLACQRPDPAVELLAQLGIDPQAARNRLGDR
jgi:ATP-dependent Clp protease ATP-binding subunit ClpA